MTARFHDALGAIHLPLMGAAKRTVLYDLHRKLGARMTEFAGFEMPVSYTGIIEEHLAVRTVAGLFDLSHMGEFELRGPGALPLLERALTNSAARLWEGQAQYSLICTETGGVVDDIIVYRLGSARYMLCVNAGNIAADRRWLLELNSANGFGADFHDLSEETALLAVQGPRALTFLQSLASKALTDIGRFWTVEADVAGTACLIARTGYTGEDGFELFLPSVRANRLFETLIEAARKWRVVPCGLGARDTLRLEAGLPLYGQELDRDTSPLEARLDPFVKFGRGFVGEAALTAQRKNGCHKRLCGIQTDDGRSVARHGYRIVADGDEIGKVTSGSFAPSLNRPVAMAYIYAPPGTAAHEAGHKVRVEIRQRAVEATLVTLPFYRRPKNR